MTTRVFATYAGPEQLLAAVQTLRSRGYQQLEAYTPHSVEQLAEALGHRTPVLPMAAFGVGMAAAGFTYFVQWLIDDYLYPINVGNRPPHFPLSYVPICFEMGVLFAALTTFVGVLVGGRLGRLWSPVFETPSFQTATRDRYWIEVSLTEDHALAVVEEHLRATGAEEVIAPEEVPCE